MPSLQAAFRAAALHRAQQQLAAGQKSIVRSGPTLQRHLIGRPLPSRDWLPETAIERLFKLSGLVYRSAVSLATAVGSVRWQVEVRTKDRWEAAGDDHELQRLLDQPHPHFNRQSWNEVAVLYLVLLGNSLTQKTLASGRTAAGAKGGRVLEMVPLVPEGISPVPDAAEWVSRYEFKGPPKKVWEASEILHVKLPDPGNPFWGMSPFQAVRRIISTDLAAIAWNESSMQNRAVSDGVLAFEAALTTDQYERAKDQVWEQHQGSGNAHEPWVLGGGVDWQPMERTPVEMDFNATRMRLREDVLSSAGIPPVVAGYFENATLANAEASRRIFWEDSLIPGYVERIAGALNGGIVPHFGDSSRLRVTYDISGVPALRDDLVKKAGALRILVSAGTPYNDAIAELEMDLAPIPGLGEVPFGLESLRALPGAGTEEGQDPGAAPPPAQPGAGTEQDVEVLESAVLNGAQITAATAIVTAVAAGDIPRDAGMGQLQVLFNLTPQQAEQIMGSAGTDTPTTPNPKPATEGDSAPLQFPAAAPAKSRRPAGRKLSATVTTSFATSVADAEAPAIRRAFLALVAKLREGVTAEELATVIRAGDSAAAIAKLSGAGLPDRLRAALGDLLRQTTLRGAELAAQNLAQDAGLNLAVDASRLNRWLVPYTQERVTQLTNTTEAAAREFFQDLAAGRLGDDATAAAKLLRETWGLHRQQAAGVRSVYALLLERGKSADEALGAAGKLARVRLVERAKTIAEHESLVAANRGNGLLWEQAVSDGEIATAKATWFTEEDGDVDDECVSLADQEIDLAAGDRFVGASGATYREPPEPHPGCRCGLLMSALT